MQADPLQTGDAGAVAASARDMAGVLATLLPREAFARAQLVAQESGERLDAVATRLGLVSEAALCAALAEASGLSQAGTEAVRAAPAPDAGLSLAFLRDCRALAIAVQPDLVTVAVVDPFDAFVAPAFAYVHGCAVARVVGRKGDIEARIEAFAEAGADGDAIDDAVDIEDLDRLRDLVSDAPAIRAVNRLIAEAVDERASDIHLEPTEDSLLVRYRIDGMLREVTRLPAAMRGSIVARIKVVAGLDISERRLPQDGRLRVAVRGHEIDLRVATAPSIHGESVVMRILDRAKLALDFAVLGFDEGLAGAVRRAIHRPHGIVLVTGPTGSGKTTTLYAALAELNAVERKLLTVEDPIEYRLPGVIQAQIHPAIGFTFAAALRSFLRQDPDVIMVGEIRDGETAQIAVQAALTGHLILATLHTNTAAGAVGRLIDMGVEPFLLGSVLAGVLAQRLVRRLCVECRTPYETDHAMRKALGIDARQLWHAVGCPACHGTGYAGRVAVFDFLPVDEAIARLILQGADAPTIEAVARAQGHRGLTADGFAKAAQGLTTVEDVLRVAQDGAP